LHGDQRPVTVAPGRFAMVNGAARLAIASLNMDTNVRIEPTLVETELYVPARSRPQPRGFHLSLISPRTEKYEFVTGIAIESAGTPSRFAARLTGGTRVDLSSDGRSGRVWTGPDRECDGDWAFTLSGTQGELDTIGLSGSSLETAGVSLVLDRKANVVLSRTGLKWTVESFEGEATEATLRVSGDGEKTKTEIRLLMRGP
jgi:hypothetical protein